MDNMLKYIEITLSKEKREFWEDLISKKPELKTVLKSVEEITNTRFKDNQKVYFDKKTKFISYALNIIFDEYIILTYIRT